MGGLERPNAFGGLRIEKPGFDPSLELLLELFLGGHDYGGIKLAEEQGDSKTGVAHSGCGKSESLNHRGRRGT